MKLFHFSLIALATSKKAMQQRTILSKYFTLLHYELKNHPAKHQISSKIAMKSQFRIDKGKMHQIALTR